MNGLINKLRYEVLICSIWIWNSSSSEAYFQRSSLNPHSRDRRTDWGVNHRITFDLKGWVAIAVWFEGVWQWAERIPIKGHRGGD